MNRQVPLTKKQKEKQKRLQKERAAQKLEAFALSPHKRALFYTGLPKKETIAQKLLRKYFLAYRIVETLLLVSFIVYASITDLRLLLILPAIGALVFFKDAFVFTWWYLKVFVLQREFYASRRRSYKDGGLLHYLNNWRPKVFRPTVNGSKKTIIIWAASPKLQVSRFNTLQKNGTLESKEYISAL